MHSCGGVFVAANHNNNNHHYLKALRNVHLYDKHTTILLSSLLVSLLRYDNRSNAPVPFTARLDFILASSFTNHFLLTFTKSSHIKIPISLIISYTKMFVVLQMLHFVSPIRLLLSVHSVMRISMFSVKCRLIHHQGMYMTSYPWDVWVCQTVVSPFV